MRVTQFVNRSQCLLCTTIKIKSNLSKSMWIMRLSAICSSIESEKNQTKDHNTYSNSLNRLRMQRFKGLRVLDWSISIKWQLRNQADITTTSNTIIQRIEILWLMCRDSRCQFRHNFKTMKAMKFLRSKSNAKSTQYLSSTRVRYLKATG